MVQTLFSNELLRYSKQFDIELLRYFLKRNNLTDLKTIKD